jgi:hypothetical protein
LQIFLSLAPKYGMVIELDDDGALLEGYQDPEGRTAWISEADEWKGYLYMGSFTNPFLARIKLSE